jgi:signal transduction histidine kinase
MFEGQLETAALIVTGGAVAFALVVAIVSHRITAGVRAARAKWRAKAEELEWKVDRSDAIFAAYPGALLVWEDDALDAEEVEDPTDFGREDQKARKRTSDWGKPRVFGSPLSILAMLRFAEASDGPDAGSRILDGIADYDAVDDEGQPVTLRRKVEALRTQGVAFSVAISGPQGSRIEADGRPAGRRAVLWLTDSTVKSIENVRSREGLQQGESGGDAVAFLDILSKAPFPVFRISSGLKLVWANATYLAAVDCRSLQDAISRDAQLDDRMKEQVRSTLNHGTRTDEVRPVVVNGERRWHAITLFPVAGGVAGVALDVTREHERRDTLERYVRAQDEALNHLRDAVAIFSNEQKLVFHNKPFRDLFKLDEAWLNQRPYHGEILDRLRERRLIPDQANYPSWRTIQLGAYQNLDKDAVEDTWPLPDERMLGVVRVRHPLGGLLLIFNDKTKEIALETRYNTLIQVQRATLDRLNEGVAVFGSDGRLKLHNAAFETMWGIPAGELAPGEPFDRLVERCRERFADMAEWAEIKARITDVSPESRRAVTREMKRSDDTVLTYLQRSLPDGSTVIAFHDVTAIRERNDALAVKNQALEAAEKVKTRFVENVSYHLRTPLTSVMGFAQLLSVTAEEKLSESEKSQLEAIIQASADLNKLVENIIVIAAIDAGKVALDLTEMEVRPTLEAALAMVNTSEGETGIRFSISCPREVGAITADQAKLKVALYNLIVNAQDHTSPGGRIEVGAERIGQSGVRIWVEDDGEGIPYDRQGKIFEAFETDGRRGAGLGLTLVRKYVEMHGGWMDIESQPNVGTRVTMHLPVSPAKALAKGKKGLLSDT